MKADSKVYADYLGYYEGVQFGVKMNVLDAKPIEEDWNKRFAQQGLKRKPPLKF